jgi:hypothetical protein
VRRQCRQSLPADLFQLGVAEQEVLVVGVDASIKI